MINDISLNILAQRPRISKLGLAESYINAAYASILKDSKRFSWGSKGDKAINYLISASYQLVEYSAAVLLSWDDFVHGIKLIGQDPFVNRISTLLEDSPKQKLEKILRKGSDEAWNLYEKALPTDFDMNEYVPIEHKESMLEHILESSIKKKLRKVIKVTDEKGDIEIAAKEASKKLDTFKDFLAQQYWKIKSEKVGEAKSKVAIHEIFKKETGRDILNEYRPVKYLVDNNLMTIDFAVELMPDKELRDPDTLKEIIKLGAVPLEGIIDVGDDAIIPLIYKLYNSIRDGLIMEWPKETLEKNVYNTQQSINKAILEIGRGDNAEALSVINIELRKNMNELKAFEARDRKVHLPEIHKEYVELFEEI